MMWAVQIRRCNEAEGSNTEAAEKQAIRDIPTLHTFPKQSKLNQKTRKMKRTRGDDGHCGEPPQRAEALKRVAKEALVARSLVWSAAVVKEVGSKIIG